VVLAALVASGPEVTRVDVGGSRIDVTIGPAEPSVPRKALMTWVERAAHAVSAYYGRFPVPYARLSIATGGKGAVGNGVTFGGNVPHIRIRAGRRTSQASLDEDAPGSTQDARVDSRVVPPINTCRSSGRKERARVPASGRLRLPPSSTPTPRVGSKA
jgi:hypothetical protein